MWSLKLDKYERKDGQILIEICDFFSEKSPKNCKNCALKILWKIFHTQQFIHPCSTSYILNLISFPWQRKLLCNWKLNKNEVKTTSQAIYDCREVFETLEYEIKLFSLLSFSLAINIHFFSSYSSVKHQSNACCFIIL